MREWDVALIAECMHQRDAVCFADAAHRDVHFGDDAEAFEDVDEPSDDVPEGWVEIPTSTSDEDFREMEAFVAALTDPVARARLQDALAGPRPFRRFRDAVFAETGLGRAWGGFRDARRQCDAVEWLAEEELIDQDEAARLRDDAHVVADAAIAAVHRAEDTGLREVEALERELQTPRRRHDAAWLDAVLAPGFEEVGASGRVLSRGEVMALLSTEDDHPVVVHDPICRRLGVDTVLVRWVSDVGGRVAVRTSVWRQTSDRWRLEHHQGTRVL